jgi:6-phosphogluconolactonase (cycloisomerase 2 family)
MSEQLICVGSYTAATGGKGAGITTFRCDPETGALREAGTLEMASPSWLTWHPTLPVLYAANETADGTVTAVAMDRAGALSVLGAASTGGADPCHLAVTSGGGHLLCANYTGGNLTVFSLGAKGEIVERTDLVAHEGSGPDTDRQEAAHVHMVVPNADGSIVSAVDLGTDEIRSYRLASGKLEPLSVSRLPPGTGPRQLVRKPGTPYAYVVGELAGTVVTMLEGPAGTFTVQGTTAATTPEPAGIRNLVAHLEFSADGEEMYVSSRGPDCITTFHFDGPVPHPVAVHPSDGWPRHFSVQNGRCYSVSQNNDALLVFDLSGGPAERYPIGTPAFVIPVPAR